MICTKRYWEMNLEIDFLTLKEMAGYLIGITRSYMSTILGEEILGTTIFDHYRELLNSYDVEKMDDIQWHYHPMSTYREAHRCVTSMIQAQNFIKSYLAA